MTAESLNTYPDSQAQLSAADWLGQIDLAGVGCPISRLQSLLLTAPALNTPHLKRMFWFILGLYHGRCLHEDPGFEPAELAVLLAEL